MEYCNDANYFEDKLEQVSFEPSIMCDSLKKVGERFKNIIKVTRSKMTHAPSLTLLRDIND